MLTTENILLFLAVFYLAATAYSLISHQKSTHLLAVTDLIISINNRASGWIVITPLVALLALLYNLVVTSFWFLGVVVYFIAWLLKWVWNEVIVAGGYFLFTLLWHYLVKWPWKLLLLSFGKILSSLKLNYLFTGTLAIAVSLSIMFLGRFVQMLFEAGIWVTYLFGVFAIIPIGVGLSWIVQLLKGKSKEEAKTGSKKYFSHLLSISFVLIAIVLVQGGIIYLGTFTSFSSVFSTLLAGANLFGSFLIIVNSIVIIFSLAALPSFSDQYNGENKDMITSFFKYLINHNWGKYVIAAPTILIPLIIACAFPYIITQGISYVAGEISDQIFETRLVQLRKTQETLQPYNYEKWLDTQATPDDSLKLWKRKDLERTNTALSILNTESTHSYMQTFYKAHSSVYGALPIGAFFYLFDRFYNFENTVVSTVPLSPVVVSIDTSTRSDLNSKTIPRIQDNLALADRRLEVLNRKLREVCKPSENETQTPPATKTESEEPRDNQPNEQVNSDECAIQRARLNQQIAEETKVKVNISKDLVRAKEVASHLEEIYNLEKFSNSNNNGSSKIAYLLISLWLCLLIGLAFSPVIPLFAQVNHNIFTEANRSELFVLSQIRSARAANPNQPLLGILLFLILISAQPAVSKLGIDKWRDLIPPLPKIGSVLNTLVLKNIPEVTVITADSTSQGETDTDNTNDVAETNSEQNIKEEVNDNIVSWEEADEKPKYTGNSFNYNSTLHTENDAPEEKYEVTVSYIIEIDGSVSDITGITNNGYGLEEEIINALKMTSGDWQPARENGVSVRCKITQTFNFPTGN